ARQGIEHYDAADRSFHIQKFVNHDPMVCALGHCAITEWVLGFPERAFQVADRTSCMMGATKHIPTTIVGQYALCILFAYARSFDRLRMTANQMVAACEQLGAPQYTGVFMVFAGYAQALETQHVDCVRRMREGLALHEAARSRLRVSQFRAMIAEACWHIGDVAGGLAEIAAAIEELERLGQFGWQALALIVRSRLQTLAGNEEAAATS